MAFVLSAGQVRAIQRQPSPHYVLDTGAQLRLTADLAVTYEELWRTQPAMRTVISFLARNIAQLSIGVFEKVSDTDRVQQRDHPLARLLDQPLPGTPMTRYRLISTLVQDLGVFDRAYWLKMRSPEGTVSLLPLRPRMVTPRGTDWWTPTEYRIQGLTAYRDVPANQVVAFWGYNPEDPKTGVAPAETLRQILAEEHSAASYREQLWRNGARAAGYLERPGDAPRWSDPARTRFRNEWQAQYTGDGPQAGGTPILEDGMSFKAAGVSPKDAQYVESRKLTREEVATAYHVPPVLMGLMEGATFSNTVELHKMLYQDTLPPWLEWITQDIEAQLLPDLDMHGATSGRVYVEFNLESKLRGSFEVQAQAFQSAVGGPYMTRSEARSLMNLPHDPDADDLIVPLNVSIGGLASPRATDPNNQPAGNGPALGVVPAAAAVDAVLAKFFDRQQRTVASRIGAHQADPIDADRWRAELTADLSPLIAPDPPALEG